MTGYKEVFYNQGGEALAQVAQRGSGCFVLGDIQSQAEWGSEHPGLEVGIPAYSMGGGTR